MALKINDNGTDRKMTEAEETTYLAAAEQLQIQTEAFAEAKTVKAAARQAVLDKLGLTADEAAALLG